MKAVSPALFGIALVCFLLPFVSVSCGGQKVAQFSGTELAFGTTIQPPGNSRQPPKKLEHEPIVLLALLACVAGLIMGIVEAGSSIKPIVSMAAAIAALTLLILFKIGFDQQVLKEGQGRLQVEYQAGFWLFCLLQITIVGISVWRIAFEGKGQTQRALLCDGCGGHSPPGTLFCPNCGLPHTKPVGAVGDNSATSATEEQLP